MKYIHIITTIATLGACCLTSCVKDLQDEINEGKWNHERQVIDIKFENQVGVAEIETIDAATGSIEIALNTAAVSDLSAIKISALQLSYQAEATVKAGDALNFNNADRSASFTVKATTGETRVYTVTASEFTEDILGTWKIDAMTIYGGTGPEYGGGAVMQLADKPWCWNEATGPLAECDNSLTFILEGVSEEGNTFGKCINDAGADGQYFDSLFIGNNPETGENVDLSGFYRQIPEGESTWYRDYDAGTISFTDSAGKVTTGQFTGPGTEDVGYDKSFTVDDHALSFSLNGTDDWTNIYTDYDKFVKKPRKLWITIHK